MRAKRSKTKLALIAGVAAAIVSGGVATAQMLLPLPVRAVGADCSDYPGGEACTTELCVDATIASVCSSYCTTDADCSLPDWGCRSITQGSGEPVRFCSPRRVVANP